MSVGLYGVFIAPVSCTQGETAACDATSATVVGTCAADTPCTITVSGDDDVTIVLDDGSTLPAGLEIDGGTIKGTVTEVTTAAVDLTLTRTACGDDSRAVLLLIDVKAPECATDDDCRVGLASGSVCNGDDDCNDGALCAPGFGNDQCVPLESSCVTGGVLFSITSVDGVAFTGCTTPATRCNDAICSFL